MISQDRRPVLVGFLVAAAVLAGLFWYVGAGEVLAVLVRADLSILALVAATALGWLAAWGLVLRTVLGILGSGLAARTSILVYSAAVFANNVTPFGQAGGEPITALVIADVTDSRFERGLAAIASVDALNFVPSILLALSGIAFYAIRVDFGDRLETVATAVVALAIAAPLVLGILWYHRYDVEHAVVAGLSPVLLWLRTTVPRLPVPTADGLRTRIEGFFGAIERIATEPRHLLVALGYSTLGWLLQALGLWLTFLAFDVTIPPYVPLFVIPIGTIASVLPTPGGLGGVEAVHVVLLTLTTPVSAATVAAAVAIHRIGGFLLMTSIGGGSMAFLWMTDHDLAVHG